MKEPEIAIVGTKGQIVIPQQLRRELKIKPKTRLAVYRKEDKLVITKLNIPSLGRELDSLFREIDKSHKGKKRPSEKEILEEIQAYRRENGPNKAHDLASVVIDTNVLVSALIGRGKPRSLLAKLFESHNIVSSREMLAELVDVLSREKFANVKRSEVTEFLSLFVAKSVIVTIGEPLKIVSDDPDDDMVLSTAFEGKTEYIITGDDHLLKLKEFRGIKIVSVREMLDSL